MFAAQTGRQGAGHRRLGRPNPEPALRQVALVAWLGGEPTAEHLVQCLSPFGRHLQAISQVGPLHLLPQDLIEGGEAGLQLSQQASLPILLPLALFVTDYRPLPLRLQLGLSGTAELQLGGQGV
ncbi:hypothetical protein D3C85_1225270 [compost metagenome]